MAIEEELKKHEIKYSHVEEKEEFEGFKVEELKDADFSKFEDSQLKAAHLLTFRYLKQDPPQFFSREEWEAIQQRVKAELDKRAAGPEADQSADQSTEQD